jgi:hypothetical protein
LQAVLQDNPIFPLMSQFRLLSGVFRTEDKRSRDGHRISKLEGFEAAWFGPIWNSRGYIALDGRLISVPLHFSSTFWQCLSAKIAFCSSGGSRLNMARSNVTDPLALLTGELKNFQEIARHIMPLPGEIPTLEGIDVFGDTMPLNGVVGGDHIIYVDYQKRYDLQARINMS